MTYRRAILAGLICCGCLTVQAVAQSQPPNAIRPVPRKPAGSTTKPAAKSSASKLSEEDLLDMFKRLTRQVEQTVESNKQATKPKDNGLRDRQLIEMHRDFVRSLEKAGLEYEEEDKIEQAVEAYNAILRLLPEHRGAAEGIGRIFRGVATKDKEIVQVAADKGWQSTGLVLVAGNPVKIEARGEWTFTLTRQLGPEGLSIPKELRSYKMGSLIGLIVTPKETPEATDSFHIGVSKSFVARKTGVLYLRMYDQDPRDNEGEIDVMVQSTFAK